MEAPAAFGKGCNENSQEGIELIQSSQKEYRDSGSIHEFDKDASNSTDCPVLNSLPRCESEVPVEKSTQDGNVEAAAAFGKGSNENGQEGIELIQSPKKEYRDSGSIHEFNKDASNPTDGPVLNSLPRYESEVPVEQSTQDGNMKAAAAFGKGCNENGQEVIELIQSPQKECRDSGSIHESNKDASNSTDGTVLNSLPRCESEVPVEQSTQDSNMEAAAAFGKGSNENGQEGIELIRPPQKEYRGSGSVLEFKKDASNSNDGPVLNSLPRCESKVPVEQLTQDGSDIPVEQLTLDANDIPVEQSTQDGNAIPVEQSTQDANDIPVEQSTQDANDIPVEESMQDGNAISVEQSTQDGDDIPVERSTQDGDAIPVEQSTQDGNDIPVLNSLQRCESEVPVEQSTQDGNDIPVEQSTQVDNAIPVEQSTQDANDIPVEQSTQDGDAISVEQSTQDANDIPVEQSMQDGNAIPAEQSTHDGNAIPAEQSTQDGNPIQSPVGSGRRMKWKDRARSRFPSPAASVTENSPKWKDRARSRPRCPAVSVTENSPANARTAIRTYKRRAGKDLGLRPSSIPTPSVVPTGAVQPSPPSSPPSSPGVLNKLQTQSPESPGLETVHTISPPPLQLSRTQATPLSCEQPGEASNSPSWCPVAGDTPNHPVHDVLFNSPAFTSDEFHPVEIEEEFSPPVGSPVSPSKSRGHVASKPPHKPSGKPPRPPQRLLHGLSMTRSRGVKRSLPSTFTSPLAVRQKTKETQQAPSNGEPYASPANETITDPRDPHFQDLGPPHTYLQSQSIPTSSSDRVSEPLPPSCCASFLPASELVPPEHIDFRNGLHQWESGDVPTPEQRRMQHKRSLRQLQTQVKKKLKTWGLKAHLFQEVDGGEADDNGQKLLVINEAQRDAFVKNMVESCRKDRWMRATFLDAVKNLACAGVLQTSACHLVAQGPCAASQEVVKAWREMTTQAQENSSATVNLYKAVDLLHKQGEIAMEKLLPPKDKTLCSLNKRPDGAWEVVTPHPVKRVSTKEK